MNYSDTLIEVADDCPTKKAQVPQARGGKKTKAAARLEPLIGLETIPVGIEIPQLPLVAGHDGASLTGCLRTGLLSTPMPSIAIATSSRSCRVTSCGGTIPVPVSSTHPCAKLWSRPRYSRSSGTFRRIADVEVSPA